MPIKQGLRFFIEGLFCKCYNEDAMVFVEHVKSYKVVSKFIKNVGEEVLSIGFPVSELEKGSITTELISSAIGATKTEQLEKQVVFSIENKDLKKNYASWRIEMLALTVMSGRHCERSEAISTPTRPDCFVPRNDVLIRMIQEFDLANSTPMQGLMFVQELKKHIQANT